jgi:hypothetical protein
VVISGGANVLSVEQRLPRPPLTSP